MRSNLRDVAIVIMLVAIGFLFFQQYEKDSKTVYVDTGIILTKYKGMKDARVKIEQQTTIMNANVDSLFADFDKEIKSYEKERSKMSKKERQLKEEILRNKQQQLLGYQEATQKKIQEEEQKLTQTPVNEINDYISEYGKKYNCTMILGANGSGNILYAEDAVNITDEILEGLHKEYGGANE